jgi:hypothetical protein
MQQMLAALYSLRRAGKLDSIYRNFDKARGVNRDRILLAIKVTYVRGSSEAFKIFMASDDNSIQLSGIEPEGRKAIEHVLLTNKDN